MSQSDGETTAVLTAWQRQMETRISPYLALALAQQDGMQVVLFLNRGGDVGTPKLSITLDRE